MREIIVKSNSFTAKDSINSRSGQSLQDMEDASTLTIVAAAAMNVTDEEDGELKKVSVLVTEDKEYMTSISATVFDVMPDVIELLNEEPVLEIRVNKRESNGGREFITLTIL